MIAAQTKSRFDLKSVYMYLLPLMYAKLSFDSQSYRMHVNYLSLRYCTTVWFDNFDFDAIVFAHRGNSILVV